VAPYRWEGPADVAPVRDLIDALAAARVDALAIFSSSQIHNLFSIAEALGRETDLHDALNRPNLLIGSVGPVSSQAIRAHGLDVDVEPAHPKMGHLILALAEAFSSRAPSSS
jgi:uroporphyrinogen-III synthase